MDIVFGGNLALAFEGGRDADTLTVDATGLRDLGRLCSASVALSGGQGGDQLTVQHRGSVDGVLTLDCNGGGQADAVTIRSLVDPPQGLGFGPDPGGIVQGTANGGGGKDRLSFDAGQTVIGDLVTINALIDGGPGKDQGFGRVPMVRVP